MTALIVADTEDINGAGGDIVLTEPSGVAANDLLIAHLLNYNSGGSPLDPGLPSGFADISNIAAVTNQNDRVVFDVVAGAGGPHTSTIGSSSTFSDGKLLRLLDVDPTAPIDGSNTASGTASSVALPAVTTGSAHCLAVALLTAQAQAFTAMPTDWLLYERYDSNFSAVYFRFMGASGQSTGTSSQAFAGSTSHSVTVVTLAPADVPWATIAGLVAENGTSLGSANAQPTFAAPQHAAVSGDLALYFISHENPGATAITLSTGWDLLGATSYTADVLKAGVAARIMDGGANDTLSVSGAAQDYAIVGVIIPANEHGVTAVTTDIKIGTGIGSSNAADPPSLDTGSVKDWLVFAGCSIRNTASGDTLTVGPVDYATLVLTKTANSTSSCSLGVAARGQNGQTFNPGAFTNTTRPWIGITLAVPPAVPSVPAFPFARPRNRLLLR